ncbi:uncharacterized protein EI90DRAFT_3131674 [Cantharellus anzutake]|uniref:uncharacterized protein n=1 Tax=Cantharellus anzutake TaxID=1750568 RepID=UPI0019037B83|nr:uncharacterized protein EI90DRAFT_3131674 [Cantharellus anzutake]KAF8321424.1 hypothetical protein EI90DRAFT_3131674 [Cantharellus anzutake]
MAWLLLLRYLFLSLLVVIDSCVLILSSTVFSIADTHSDYRPIYVYLMFLSIFTILFVFFLIVIDSARKGALLTHVLVELLWLSVLWTMHLGGASALTAASQCRWTTSCSSTQTSLIVFLWLSVTNLLGHLATLLISALMHLDREPNIWSTSVRDVPWFSFRRVAASTVYRNTQSGKHESDAQRPSRAAGENPHALFPNRSLENNPRAWRSRYTNESFSEPAPNERHYGFAHNMEPSSNEGLVRTSEEPPPQTIPISVERLAPPVDRNAPSPPLRPDHYAPPRQHRSAYPSHAVESSEYPAFPLSNPPSATRQNQTQSLPPRSSGNNTSLVPMYSAPTPPPRRHRTYPDGRPIPDPRALPPTPAELNALYPSSVQTMMRPMPPTPLDQPRYPSTRNGEVDWNSLSPAQRIAMEVRSRKS